MGVVDQTFHEEYENFLAPSECKGISEIIRHSEEEILSIPNANASNYYSGTTKQFNVYNWLNHSEIKKFDLPKRLFRLPFLANIDHIMVQCWANILRQGENIGPHIHASEVHSTKPDDQFYACNLFISGNTNTTTYYEDTGYTQNAVGCLSVISPSIEHSVPTHLYQKPRISIAMDIYIHPLSFHMKELYPNRFNLYERTI